MTQSSGFSECFVLTWVNCGKATPICEGSAAFCQRERTRLRKEPQYSSGKLVVRRSKAFLKKPIIEPKIK